MDNDPFIDLIKATVDALENSGITYAITGSVASGIHGEPFQSMDVDFAIRMTVEQANKLQQVLPNRFYRSDERLVEVARDSGMANLVDTETGMKVDLSVLPSKPYYDLIMNRRILSSFGPGRPDFYTVTPEDIILMKLEWRKDTQSQKQWDNALSVVRVQGVSLDWKYLRQQASALHVEDDLVRLRDEAGI